MGFDPRTRGRQPSRDVVTSNVQALLAENDTLRRQVRSLQLQLERLQLGTTGATTGAGPLISPAEVERWGKAMARHPRWRSLRLGPPGGLRGVVESQRRRWWDPRLELEQELDRRSPGLGSALAAALRGPHSRGRWAVRAAFALYGQRAPEWLSEEPLRVVEELLRQQQSQQQSQQQRRGGTRTANHSANQGGASDPRRQAALRLLGLQGDVISVEAIKQAYRRLAKTHHPDLGGDAAAFQALKGAYRLLLDLH